MLPRVATASVPLPAIDRKDGRFKVTTAAPTDALNHSIERLGLLQPITLWEAGTERHVVVAGFRRIAACSAAGMTSIPARVLPRDTAEAVCIRLAVADNCFQRTLNPVEIARCLHLLDRICETDADLVKETAVVGLPVNAAAARRLMGLVDLPWALQQQIIDERITVKIALELATLPEPSPMLLADLFSTLGLGFNLQRELLAMTTEIAARDDESIAAVLQREAMVALLADAETDRGQKRQRIRELLRRWRFPALTAVEQRFEVAVKDLKLGSQVRFSPPRFFEGGSYTMHCAFSNAEELVAMVSRLNQLAESGRLQPVFQVVVEPEEGH